MSSYRNDSNLLLGRESLEESLAVLQQQEDTLSDDDNAQQLEEEPAVNEDPLLLAIDDLEGRVVTALDDIKLHPGVRSSSAPDSPDVHQELATLLRPVLEIAAHTGPSIARTYFRGVGVEGIDMAVEDVYERTVSDLVLPVLLEIAQSDTSPAKRAAALEFFRNFWQEAHKAGSWLDNTTDSSNAGPYGSGTSSHGASNAPRHLVKRRRDKNMAREGEILRYWVQAAIACTTPGVFTAEDADVATASRGIIAASASLRPSLKHIVQRIKDTDDRGANRLYKPVMEMVENVLKKMFLSKTNEAMLAACIKFLEIVILCCSRKPQDPAASRRKGHSTASEDFSLEDLPEGHPVITREALETIADYAYTTLRGFTLLGGQIKMDVNLLQDMMLSGVDSSPSASVVSILKPAALAYLEIESSLPKETPETNLNRSEMEFDFMLSQKSYALTINALSALAIHRPVFFKESAITLARRAYEPPVESDNLSGAAVKAVTSQLRASCLTLLRNALSVTTGAYDILHKVLKSFDMEIQADKALSMARQADSLKTAGRAARNRANIYYEWETSEKSSKRQRETDDALAKMRAAKAARGLGHGIQLPSNMTDAIELILLNLENLPSKKPAATSKARKVPVTLDFIVDAIMTNGASLTQEEGRWYDRDGGSAWILDPESENYFNLSNKMEDTLDLVRSEPQKNESEPNAKRRKLFEDQCKSAASDAMARIISDSLYSRSKRLADFGSQISAKLAFTLKGLKPANRQSASYDMARNAILSTESLLVEGKKKMFDDFAEVYPLVASYLSLSATPSNEKMSEPECSFYERILNEALLQSNGTDTRTYDRSLELFVASTVYAGKLANEKPIDNSRKGAANESSTMLQRCILRFPRLTSTSLLLLCAMCDTEDINRRAADAAKKTSQEFIAISAATHAAKVAAEKRATTALLILRDTAFQHDKHETRKDAVRCAVKLATGSLSTSPSIQEKSLKLVMNVLYPRNKSIEQCVVDTATEELEMAMRIAVDSFEEIEKANAAAVEKGEISVKPLVPVSDEERKLIDRLKKPAVLYMALCIRNPSMIEKLFKVSCVNKADILSKAVRSNMSKLSRAAAAKHGAATIAIDVAAMTGNQEIPMLLSFLEHLASSPDDDLIQACFRIQESKVDDSGQKDPRFIIPVVSAMKRKELIEQLPGFVLADDKIFLAALVRMNDRVGRHALLFRDEPDQENPSLHGMTLCEQLVFLHKLDFSAAEIPQKRYLAAIKLCLEDGDVYNDRVIMSALDHMSGTFLTQSEKLPLAFMRTCILVCTKHESLHSWVAHVLLPRLVDAKIFEDARQWEGWMRCAHMLEKSGESGVDTSEAIQKLPPEQLMQYQTKWAGK